MDLLHIVGPTGTTQNIGGLTGRVRLTAIADMDTIVAKVELPSDPADEATLVTIATNHTWSADSGKVELEMNQARDTTGVGYKYTGQTPGSAASDHAALVVATNTKLIFWAELADGTWLQFGSERFPAELKMKWSSGKNQGEYRGFEITVEAFESTFQIYTGTFTMNGPNS
jgi:hypothetical protein